jgi:hypothetical protein
MKKPHLVVTKQIEGIPVQAACSHCADAVFHTGYATGMPHEHQRKLESLFREHLRKIHMTEDANQSAARDNRRVET